MYPATPYRPADFVCGSRIADAKVCEGEEVGGLVRARIVGTQPLGKEQGVLVRKVIEVIVDGLLQ